MLNRLNIAFVVALNLLVVSPILAQQIGGLGGTTGGLGGFGGATGGTTGGLGGATGATGATGAAGATGTGGQVGGLLNQQSTFQGFTQNFGSGNSPFYGGVTSLSGGTNGIGTLSGGATGTAGTQGRTTGQTGLTGLGGIGGLSGGLGGGLGGLGGRSGFGQGGLGQGGFGQSGFGNNQRGGQNQQQSRATIRTTLKPAFDRPPRTETGAANVERGNQITARMDRLPLPDKYRGVKISIVGRTAILNGEVNSEADAKFIARLVSLEPGIDSVDSRLTKRVEPVEAVPVGSNR